MRGPASSDESGMTLIEVLVTITILVTIAFPLASVLTTALIIPSEENQRVVDTGDAQLLQNFLATDVQSAASTDTTGTITCAGATGVLLGLRWTDQTGLATTVTKTVAYGQSGTTLVRYYCDTSGASSQVTVLTAVQSASFICSNGTCTATLTDKPVTQPGATPAPYSFTLSGTQRDT